MARPKILTPLPLAYSEEELAENRALAAKCSPRGGMVCLVDGHACVKIPLTKGKFALIDADDYPDIGRFHWHAKQDDVDWYAARAEYINGKTFGFRMHAHLLGFPPHDTDHINGDGLDNRRVNLRPSTRMQNSWNRRPLNTYKGTLFKKSRGKWYAKIQVNGVRFETGYFNTEEEAAFAYDLLACEHFGEFAWLNFPFPA